MGFAIKAILLFLFFVPLAFGSILDDGRLDCDEILANKLRVFSANFNIEAAGLTAIDFRCSSSLLNLKHIENLLDTSTKIRSESRSCVGKIADINLNNFKFMLLKAGIEPDIYAQTLLESEEYEKELEQNRAFFRYWGHQTLSNFLLFRVFNKNYNEALGPTVKHYMSSFRMDEGSAIYYATKIVNEFLKFAIAIQKEDFATSMLDISEVQKRVSDPKFSKNDINEFIYSGKISKDSLQKAFETALLYDKSIDILKEFIQIGVDINSGYESPLFFALNNLKSVELLLKNGADVNYSNLLGQTPLFKAVGLNDLNLVKLLVEHGADVSKRTIDINTKLAYASNLGEVLPSYIKPCDFEHTSRTIFMEAARKSDVEILKFLISVGVDLNAVDDAGFNAFDYAIMGKKEANLQYLKALGLKSNFDN